MPVSPRISSPFSMAFTLSSPTRPSPSFPEPSSFAPMEPPCRMPADHSRRQARPQGRLQRRHAQGSRLRQTTAAPILSAAPSRTSSSPRTTCRQKLPERRPSACSWSGFLTPTESGDFLLGIRCAGIRKAYGRWQASSDGVRRWHARSRIGRGPRSPRKGPKGRARNLPYGNQERASRMRN